MGYVEHVSQKLRYLVEEICPMRSRCIYCSSYIIARHEVLKISSTLPRNKRQLSPCPSEALANIPISVYTFSQMLLELPWKIFKMLASQTPVCDCFWRRS